MKNEIDYEIISAVASCGVECGTVCFEFDDIEITFNVYQTSDGADTWFVDLQRENVEIAQKLGIEFEERYRITDEELIGIIFDVYGLYHEWEIENFNENDCLYKNTKYKLIFVSPDGVVEEGWIRIKIEDNEIQFNIRQENFETLYNFVEFETDKDKEICEKLGIELDINFQLQLMYSYDKESQP